jgi:Cu/Ag efflux protein CusF
LEHCEWDEFPPMLATRFPRREQVVTGADYPRNGNRSFPMSKKLIAATVAAVIAGMSFAYAAASTETGVISKIDTKAPSITLKSGKVKTFLLDKAIDVTTLKVDEKVTVTYDMIGNKATASAVVAATN